MMSAGAAANSGKLAGTLAPAPAPAAPSVEPVLACKPPGLTCTEKTVILGAVRAASSAQATVAFTAAAPGLYEVGNVRVLDASADTWVSASTQRFCVLVH
jgi:hypothetical protein